MIEILLVTHGNLGQHLLDSAALIYGTCENAKAIALMPNTTVEELTSRISVELSNQDDGNSVIILVDLPGGSCANAALTAVRNQSRIQASIVAGANLAMLVQVLCRREQLPLNELMAKVLDSGRQAICRLWPPLAGEGKLGY